MKVKYNPKHMLFAKLLFDHAAEHRTQKTSFSRVQAVIGYANAVELLLKAVADSKGITPSRGKKYFTFDDIILSLEKKLPQNQPVPRKQDIYNLADIRNLAIHHGTSPSESAVEECHVVTLEFLRQSFRLYFKKTFDDLDLIDFVQSAKLKELLKIGKSNLSSSDFFDSRIPVKLAFVILSENLFKLLPTSRSFQYFRPEEKLLIFRGRHELTEKDAAIIETMAKLHRSVSQEIDEIKAYLALSSLGRTVGELSRFDGISSAINFRFHMRAISSSTGVKNTPEEKAKSAWFLSFATEIIIQMEEMGVSDSMSEFLQKWYDETLEKRGKVFGTIV